MTVSIERSFHLATNAQRRGGYQVTLRRGQAPEPELEAEPAARIPRISRLMALAIHYQHLLDAGMVSDASTLARLAGVTQPRMMQILNLNHLAPDIQEELLHQSGGNPGLPVCEKRLRPLMASTSWIHQRQILAVVIG